LDLVLTIQLELKLQEVKYIANHRPMGISVINALNLEYRWEFELQLTLSAKLNQGHKKEVYGVLQEHTNNAPSCPLL